jgi:hypothetical protein
MKENTEGVTGARKVERVCSNCGNTMDDSKLTVAGRPICNKCRTPEMRTGSGKAPSVKIGIEQANGESFVARVNDILRYNGRFVKNGVYTQEQFSEQAKAIREAIVRALDNADLYLRIDNHIVATQ